MAQQIAFATGVPSGIYAFYRYTGNSICLSCLQDPEFPRASPSWAGSFHRGLSDPPARALRPVNPDNARNLRITAAAGT